MCYGLSLARGFIGVSSEGDKIGFGFRFGSLGAPSCPACIIFTILQILINNVIYIWHKLILGEMTEEKKGENQLKKKKIHYHR